MMERCRVSRLQTRRNKYISASTTCLDDIKDHKDSEVSLEHRSLHKAAHPAFRSKNHYSNKSHSHCNSQHHSQPRKQHKRHHPLQQLTTLGQLGATLETWGQKDHRSHHLAYKICLRCSGLSHRGSRKATWSKMQMAVVILSRRYR